MEFVVLLLFCVHVRCWRKAACKIKSWWGETRLFFAAEVHGHDVRAIIRRAVCFARAIASRSIILRTLMLFGRHVVASRLKLQAKIDRWINECDKMVFFHFSNFYD